MELWEYLLDELGPGITLGVVVVVGVVAAAAAIIKSIGSGAEESDRQRKERERERWRQRTMLYEDMTVDEAQTIVSDWEEMTKEERIALPKERRADVHQIREDLSTHKRQRKLAKTRRRGEVFWGCLFGVLFVVVVLLMALV